MYLTACMKINRLTDPNKYTIRQFMSNLAIHIRPSSFIIGITGLWPFQKRCLLRRLFIIIQLFLFIFRVEVEQEESACSPPCHHFLEPSTHSLIVHVMIASYGTFFNPFNRAK